MRNAESPTINSGHHKSILPAPHTPAHPTAPISISVSHSACTTSQGTDNRRPCSCSYCKGSGSACRLREEGGTHPKPCIGRRPIHAVRAISQSSPIARDCRGLTFLSGVTTFSMRSRSRAYSSGLASRA